MDEAQTSKRVRMLYETHNCQHTLCICWPYIVKSYKLHGTYIKTEVLVSCVNSLSVTHKIRTC
jgi:hypothetical protein